MGFILAAVSFVLLWVLFILPQQRRMKAHAAVVARLEVGDEVMTSSGLYGTVVALDDEVAGLEVSPGVVLRVARGAVSRRLAEEAEPDPDPDSDPDPDPGGAVDAGAATTGVPGPVVAGE